MPSTFSKKVLHRNTSMLRFFYKSLVWYVAEILDHFHCEFHPIMYRGQAAAKSARKTHADFVAKLPWIASEKFHHEHQCRLVIVQLLNILNLIAVCRKAGSFAGAAPTIKYPETLLKEDHLYFQH